jgi:uncharacterized protein (DUF302 family)
MNTTAAIAVIAGLFGGIVVTGMLIWFRAPAMMIDEDPSRFDFDTTVDTIVKTAEGLQWKVPAIHPLHESMDKAGFSVEKASVIELCRPDYAVRLLEQDDTRSITSLMPCRIAVYQRSDGSVIVSRMNTALMSKMFGGLVTEVMSQASADSEQIITSVLAPAAS